MFVLQHGLSGCKAKLGSHEDETQLHYPEHRVPDQPERIASLHRRTHLTGQAVSALLEAVLVSRPMPAAHAGQGPLHDAFRR